MKKFTTLKEDTLKENIKLNEQFDTDLVGISDKLNQVKVTLEALKGESWYHIAFKDVNDRLDKILTNLNFSNTNNEIK